MPASELDKVVELRELRVESEDRVKLPVDELECGGLERFRGAE